MSTFARMLVVLLFACATAPVFGQIVDLPEVRWEDIKPLSKTVSDRSAEVGMPNDPLFGYQEGLFRQVGLTPLIEDRGIGILRQPVDVPVVIIGTGVSLGLKDLEGRIDIARSKTFARDGGEPFQDDGPHETAVASIGFATANDGVGLAGMNSSSSVISVKSMGAYTDEFGRKVLRRDDMNAVIESFKYVQSLSEEFSLLIVNASFAVNGVPADLQKVLDDIRKKDNVLLVVAAHNTPEDLSKLPRSLCVDEPNVLCVASLSGEEGQTHLLLGSAYGTAVNYTARCHDIVAQYTPEFFGRFTGNSGCNPEVAAAAALVASYMASKGRILKASELKRLMLEGSAFEAGLLSSNRPVRHPIALNFLRLFQEADRWLGGDGIRPLATDELKANSLLGDDGKPLREIKKGVGYRVEGLGFDEETTVFLNRIPLETRFISPGLLEFWVGEESSMAVGEKVLYVAKKREDGSINPFSLGVVASGIQIN